ncbi:MAG: dihydrofolate reductase family protein [Demequinaceae bacterium]|nr:dihydrofolate reductase family protein [Demequinaceae bacterium]
MNASEASLTLADPTGRILAETPSEDDLRALYPHPPGFVRLGMIAGAHGEATGLDGSSRTLSGPADLRIIRVLRAAADVVVVGAATALHENYGPIGVRDPLVATRSEDQQPTPIVAIVSFSGTLPSGLGPGNALLLTTSDAPALSLADEWGDSLVLVGRHSVSPHLLVEALNGRGLTRILCEGGPALGALLLSAGVVGDYCRTDSPVVGDDSGPLTPEVPPSWEAVHTLTAGGFTMRRWRSPQA